MSIETQVQRVVITPGEPAGIGPDVVVALAQQSWPLELVVCADAELLLSRALALKLPLTLREYQPHLAAQPQAAGTLTLLPVATDATVVPGQLNVLNSRYVLDTLARACDGCLKGDFAALITGPVHKGIINESGIAFSGHTEFFCRTQPLLTCGDDAGDRGTTGCAGDYASAIKGRIRCHHPR
ncbi:hypothetical protein OS31_11170 [Dickeya oryzae]